MKTIPLSQGQVALVDDEDYARLNEFRWFAHKSRKTFYAFRNYRDTQRRIGLMHREILGAAPGQMVDHRNRNGLDNQRANLRFATVQQNNHNAALRADNATGFKGVHCRTRTKSARKYQAYIAFGGRVEYLGVYEDAAQAAHAYDARARELFGEFAHTNFPQEVRT
jgi:hypothetical protein